MISTDDHVAAVLNWSAEHSGSWDVGSDLMVYRFADWKVAEFWLFTDEPARSEQSVGFDVCVARIPSIASSGNIDAVKLASIFEEETL